MGRCAAPPGPCDRLRRRERRWSDPSHDEAVFAARRERVRETLGPDAVPDPSGCAARDPLERHRVQVPPGQRLLVPDGLRPPGRAGRAAHRRRPRLHPLRAAARARRRDLDRLPAGRRGRPRAVRRRRGTPHRRARREAARDREGGRSTSTTSSDGIATSMISSSRRSTRCAGARAWA